MARAVSITRQAISPRLAISIVSNMAHLSRDLSGRPGTRPVPRLHLSRNTHLVLAPPCRPRSGLHAEHAKARLLDGRVQRRAERQRQNVARPARVDDAVIPKPGTCIKRMALVFELLQRGAFERLLFLLRPGTALAFDRLALDRGQNARGLLTTHHTDPRIRPC